MILTAQQKQAMIMIEKFIADKDSQVFILKGYAGTGKTTLIRSIADYLSTQSLGEFYQFNLSSCIRQQNSLTAQFVSFSLANLANIFYPPRFLQ